MAMRKQVVAVLLFGALWSASIAQTSDTSFLLREDFNTCALPAGWQVRLQGDTVTPVWYVGLAQVPDAVDQSIDGTCFFFVDGRAGGKSALAHVLELVSPPFSRGAFTTLDCRMDIHFKFGDADALEIVATNGTQERVLARYDNYRTNYDPLGSNDFFRFRSDLAFLPWSGPTQLIVRYTSPANSQGRYAGIDNIQVVGSGSGTFVLAEDFDKCGLPAGWTSEVLSGSAGWSFGFVPLGSSAFYEGNSMNGSCFAFFDDNAQGDAAAPTHIRLYSPWFPGAEFMEYELTFEALMRYSGYESFAIYLENEQQQRITLFAPEGKVAGPFFPNYERFSIALSTYRSAQWRLVFAYNDGGTRGYWVGLDNVKVVGWGDAVDFCQQALTLSTSAPCLTINNDNALYSGPTGSCVATGEGSVWFRWTADFSGVAELTTNAQFNDVVSVFVGSCSDLSWVLCYNRDEHGFTGETAHFQAQQGKDYFIRVAGVAGAFGVPRGQACVRIAPVAQLPLLPPNDDCAQAYYLAPDVPCPQSSNRHATMSTWQPSHNRLARADVWYRFHAPALAPGEELVLDAQANFSHILTVYRGTCQALTEVVTNRQGSPLRLPPLTSGQVYYVQVAGVFATVEGDVCPVLRIEKRVPPPNNSCTTALAVALGEPCTATTSLGATFSGLRPACALQVTSDVWFQFKAPALGAVRVNTGAAFDHVVAVWEGACGGLTPVFCSGRTRYCEGQILVPSLKAGQTYYLQIAARTEVANGGQVCVSLEDGALPDQWVPLALQVNQLCIGKDSVRLWGKLEGGTPPYAFLADTLGQVVLSERPFGVVVRDARGCEAYTAGVAKRCEQNACTGQLHFDLTEPTCFDASDGQITAGVSGGKGPFFFEWSNGIFTANNIGLTAGTYTLLVSETTGCTYSAQVTLTQPDALKITLDSLVQPSTGQSNGAAYVSISGGTPPWSYHWRRADGTALATTAALRDVPAGTYTLEVTDLHGCTQALTLTLTGTVRTKEHASTPHVYLFPNPASDYVWVGLSLDGPAPVEIVLFDALGRLMVRRHLALTQHEVWVKLEVERLPAGTYVVFLRTPRWAYSQRMVVER